MANESFWNISGKVVVAAIFIIGASLLVAGIMYKLSFGVPQTATSAFFLKVGDAFINGAVVGVFFAVLRTMFGFPKLSPTAMYCFIVAPPAKAFIAVKDAILSLRYWAMAARQQTRVARQKPQRPRHFRAMTPTT